MKNSLAPVLALLLVACAGTAPAPAPSPAPAPRDVLSDLSHERVDYWVERFAKGDKRPEIAAAFARRAELAPMIEAKLQRRGMPEELLYLAMAESGLNSEAHSAAGARGIWQLVPDTARRYGLRVDDPATAEGEVVDERLDPEKATDAALSYLSYLFNRFGSWYLAAAAYNAGENRVARILNDATGREAGTDADFYRLWEQFPGETRDYVPAMIALMRLGRDAPRYGFE